MSKIITFFMWMKRRYLRIYVVRLCKREYFINQFVKNICLKSYNFFTTFYLFQHNLMHYTNMWSFELNKKGISVFQIKHNIQKIISAIFSFIQVYIKMVNFIHTKLSVFFFFNAKETWLFKNILCYTLREYFINQYVKNTGLKSYTFFPSFTFSMQFAAFYENLNFE